MANGNTTTLQLSSQFHAHCCTNENIDEWTIELIWAMLMRYSLSNCTYFVLFRIFETATSTYSDGTGMMDKVLGGNRAVLRGIKFGSFKFWDGLPRFQTVGCHSGGEFYSNLQIIVRFDWICVAWKFTGRDSSWRFRLRWNNFIQFIIIHLEAIRCQGWNSWIKSKCKTVPMNEVVAKW